MLLDKPPEYQPHLQEVAELSDFGMAELERGISATEKAVADVAIEGSGLVEVPHATVADVPVSMKLGEQLSIEDEPGIQWPISEAQKGNVTSVVPETGYWHPEEMSSVEEAKHIVRSLNHIKAHDEWTSGKIDWAEFHERTADKTPRTYQQPLLRQDGQLFEQEKPLLDETPNKGVGAADGTFWHGSNQNMEPGDSVLPSGEVPDSVHQANKSDRSFNSSSSPLGGSSYEDNKGGEKDFAFGYQRELGILPTAYGDHIYKVSSPNSHIEQTFNGPEVWAEGGGTVEKRMHPDFAYNYGVARHHVNNEPFQPGLPSMENGLEFVPENELDVPYEEFYENHLKDTKIPTSKTTPRTSASPEDIALPGFEEHGKPRAIPSDFSAVIM